MKKLLLIGFLFISLTSFGQKSKGYGFVGAGLHIIEKQENIAARLNFGLLPVSNAGIGFDVQYIRDYGVPILADFRFISNHVRAGRLTVAAKVGTNIYDKSPVKGGFVYGGEVGLILGKSKNGFYLSGQYLNLQYNSKLFSYRLNNFGVSIGAKF